VKRVATVVFAFSFVASPAAASGIKATAGSLGMGAISSILCALTVIYDSEDEETSSEDFDRRGFFVGAGGGFAGENFSEQPVKDIAEIFSNQPRKDVVQLAGPKTTANADNSWSIHGHGGYRCHPRYSVAATVEYFGGFDTQWTGVLGTGSDDVDMFVATVDLKGYLLTGRYQPYVLIGGGVMNVDTKVTNQTGITGTTPNPMPPPTNLAVYGPVIQSRDYLDFTFRFGGGVDVYTTDHIVVNIGASYLLPVGTVSGTDVFTVGGGIEYRF